MFWRILGQLFSASRGRLAVALVALASGAAVTTALINLNLDAERKLSTEFRTLGANVIAEPHLGKVFWILEVPNFKTDYVKARAPQHDSLASPLLDQVILRRLAPTLDAVHAIAAPYLYLVVRADAGTASSPIETQVIMAGTWLDKTPQLSPWWKITGDSITDRDDLKRCLVGRNVAQQLGVEPGSHIELSYASPIGNQTVPFTVAGIINSGGQEDNQVIVNLYAVQNLAALQGEIGFVQMS